MNVSPKIQKLIMTLIILSGLGFVVYSTLFGNIETSLDSEGNPVITSPVGQDIIALADKLDAVEIKKNIFSSTLFTNLVDITVPIQDEEQGRTNPFSNIGSD